MLNKVILIGRLAGTPELRYTPGGKAVVQVTLCVDRTFGKGEEKETDFIPLVVWQQGAEFASNYTDKGDLVAVDGRLQIRNWTDKEGGKRKTAEVVCNDYRLLKKVGQGNAPKPTEETAEADPDHFAGIGDDQ